MRSLFLLVFLLSFIPSFSQKDNSPKYDPAKSWGLNCIGSSRGQLGLSVFYQKGRHEFEAGVSGNYDNQYFLKYANYPNEWRRRFDLRIENYLGFAYVNSFVNYSIYRAAVGYGIRFKVCRQLFLSHSGLIGAFYSTSLNRNDGVPFQWKTHTYVDFQLRLTLNLGAFKWKKD